MASMRGSPAPLSCEAWTARQVGVALRVGHVQGTGSDGAPEPRARPWILGCGSACASCAVAVGGKVPGTKPKPVRADPNSPVRF